MNQKNTIVDWTKTEKFIFRLFSLHLILYILFISDFISMWGDHFPLFRDVNKPFSFITGGFMNLINTLFLNMSSVESLDFQSDTFWGYTAVVSFFLIAVTASIVWTIFDKSKSYPVLFRYIYNIARYYLAFILFNYGIVKVFGNQFGPNAQNALFFSLPDLTPHQLFWSFMGTSKSYQLFAGLLEIIPALLLLFRRTSTLGSIIAFTVLLNVLMLNIGYDTRLKLFLFHLIIITIFLSLPDLRKLYNIFILQRNDSLTIHYPIIENNKLNLLSQVVKYSIILIIAFIEIRMQFHQSNDTKNSPQNDIVGIHTIQNFTSTHKKSLNEMNESKNWKRIAITPFSRFSVQLMNDSTETYFFNSFPAPKTFELVSQVDTSFKCMFHYNKIKTDEWLFTGTLGNDTVQFISTKIDLNKSNLLKGVGKVRWVY
jgi:hypothetical protein